MRIQDVIPFLTIIVTTINITHKPQTLQKQKANCEKSGVYCNEGNRVKKRTAKVLGQESISRQKRLLPV